MLNIERDIYGPYARASLLADYAELLALRGQSVRKTGVADFLADNDWALELVQSAESGSDGEGPVAFSEQRDNADQAATIVFEQIDERRDVLAELYPFELTDDALSLRPGIDLHSCS